MDELTAWQQRAIQAESKLREIASMPNDSVGWKQMRAATAMKAVEELDIPENILIYIRQSNDPQYPAQLCVRDNAVDPSYNVWGMTPRALYNMVRIGVDLMSQEKFFKNAHHTE
jgi:hypothetical protein